MADLPIAAAWIRDLPSTAGVGLVAAALIATTVEDGGDIGDITEVAVQATQAMLGLRRPPAPGDDSLAS